MPNSRTFWIEHADFSPFSLFRWNSLIEYAFRWSLKLNSQHRKLIRARTEQKIKFILTTKRKFGTVNIPLDSEMVNIFHERGVNVVKLILNAGDIDSFGDLANLLTLMPNLKQAKINMGPQRFVRDLPMDHVLPNLEKLKDLDITVDDQRIMKCFRKAKLNTLTINESVSVENNDVLVDFLLSQDMLMSLSVTSHGLLSPQSILAEIGKLNDPMPFRLTKLGIRMNSQDEEVLSFIKSQTETLEHVEFSNGIPSTIHVSLPEMKNLNTLSVSFLDISHDKDFYVQLGKINSVRTLELKGLKWNYQGDINFFRNFLEMFPNVQCLILPGSYKVGLDFVPNIPFYKIIQSRCKNLKLLYLCKCSIADGQQKHCMKINSLRLYDYCSSEAWFPFQSILCS